MDSTAAAKSYKRPQSNSPSTANKHSSGLNRISMRVEACLEAAQKEITNSDPQLWLAVPYAEGKLMQDDVALIESVGQGVMCGRSEIWHGSTPHLSLSS